MGKKEKTKRPKTSVRGATKRAKAKWPGSKRDMWFFFELLTVLFVKYDKSPDAVFNDPVLNSLFFSLMEADAKIDQVWLSGEKENAIARLVRDLADVYSDVRRSKLTGDALRERVRYALAKQSDVFDYKGKNLKYLLATSQDILELGGPREMAKFNVALMVDKSQRTVHSIAKRVLRRRDHLSDWVLEDALEKFLFYVIGLKPESARQFSALVIEFKRHTVKNPECQKMKISDWLWPVSRIVK